ncbi:MAG TPA: hypothetical protein VMZ53_25200 [Kofleriaceae bacterium]|nr:hypothetical protein [Kofleriaceae bacterium]
MKLAAIIGVAIVALHGAGFVYVANHSRGDELAVDISELKLDGGPGLVRKHWTKTYRGGFTRDVGVTQLVGPFQDPAKPACTGRVVIGQSFLTDQLAPIMKAMIDEQLRGMEVFPVGQYKSIQHLGLEWAHVENHLGDFAMFGKAGAPNGYIRATARVSFSRVDVPVLVVLVPEVIATSTSPSPSASPQMHFRINARADLDFGNRVLDWVSDKVGADQLASRIARQQIDDVLVTTFAPPPPFDLGDGQTLQFTYCDAPVDIANNAYGALPFGVHIEGHAGLLPPQFATSPTTSPSPSRALPSATTQLAIDLDLDALNAMLFELWRSGWLDKRLAEVGLDARFNSDPIVTEYLSIRISPPKLALPPVIAPGSNGKLRLAADARTMIDDGASTVGRVYGALDFTFGTSQTTTGTPQTTTGASPALAAAPKATSFTPSVDLGALELACEQRPNVLVPCYGDLVAAMRDRGGEFHGALTDAFARLLADIFVNRRVGADGLPADLVITSASATLGGTGTLHLELTGKLEPVN